MKTISFLDYLQSKIHSSNIPSDLDDHHSSNIPSDLDDHRRKPKVIGISGSTRCGKSSLTSLLENQCIDKKLDVQTCDLDRYADIYLDVKEEQLTDPVKKMRNHCKFNSGWEYEMSQKHNFNKLLKDFEEDFSKYNDLVILEGFRMFYDERLVEKMDIMFYLKMPKDLCYYRRMATFQVSNACFQHSLWPLHEEYERDVIKKYANDERFIIIDIEELAKSSGEYASILDKNPKKLEDSNVQCCREKTIDLILARAQEELEKREIFSELFPRTKK
jgi:uridine kinase